MIKAITGVPNMHVYKLVVKLLGYDPEEACHDDTWPVVIFDEEIYDDEEPDYSVGSEEWISTRHKPIPWTEYLRFSNREDLIKALSDVSSDLYNYREKVYKVSRQLEELSYE